MTPAQHADLAQFARVTRQVFERARAMLRSTQVAAARLRADDPETLDRIRREACELEGQETAAYERALATSAELLFLERGALLTALTESADPGPYDELSSRDPASSWYVAPEEERLSERFDIEAHDRAVARGR
jgi:hypothetical protein